jgi:hypothetical protein
LKRCETALQDAESMLHLDSDASCCIVEPLLVANSVASDQLEHGNNLKSCWVARVRDDVLSRTEEVVWVLRNLQR